MSRAGIPNKNKRGLLAELKRQYGKDFHPIMQMAKNCVAIQNEADSEQDAEKKDTKLRQANAEWSRVAEYTEPKLKAVDHKIDGDMGLIIEVVQFEDTPAE